jgi:hypothetical protein
MVMPAVIEFTTPLDEPIVATAGLLLLHVPPVVISAKVVAVPAHIEVVPVIAAGAEFTVIDKYALQPVPKE